MIGTDFSERILEKIESQRADPTTPFPDDIRFGPSVAQQFENVGRVMLVSEALKTGIIKNNKTNDVRKTGIRH